MPTKQIQDLKTLDSKLSKIETKFNKKLEQYYSDLESNALRQVSSFKKINDIHIPSSKQLGLEKLFREHFKNVEKLSGEFTKRELAKLQPDNIEAIRMLSPAKTNKTNLVYAQKLANKQVSDFQDKVKEKLSNALKANPDLSAKDLKELVKYESQSFKNVRVQATSETEASRVANLTKVEMYKKVGIDKVKFIAILDNRTSNTCISHSNQVYKIGSAELSKNTPPLHVHCRSYLIATK